MLFGKAGRYNNAFQRTQRRATFSPVHASLAAGLCAAELVRYTALKKPVNPVSLPIMDQFEGVDLADSWILGWRLDQGRRCFIIDLEVSLWPGNPYYGAPKPEEYTCYRQAQLVFEGVESVQGLPSQSEVRATQDPDGSLDYGNIYSLQQEGSTFRFETDFGEVAVKCASLVLTIEEAV